MTSTTRTQRIVSTTFLALVGALPLAAQDTSPSHLARARELAGTQFVTTEQIMCREPSAMHDIPTDLASARGAKATKVFDNLYYIGSQGVGAWIVTTSDGIIMLNAMFTPSVKSTLLPGFKSLGLDPQNVKDVVITDPHADHYGGANYFQDSIGARVYMTAADWQAMLANGDREPREGGNRGRGAGQGANGRGTGLGGGGGGTSGGLGGGRSGRGGGGGGGFGGGRNGGGSNGTQRADPFAEKAVVNFTPHRDLVAASGDTLVLGDEVLTFVQSPDKSAGTLSVLIPVKEGGSQHLAALLGGTANAPTDILKRTQLAAARALSDAAVAAHADVALSAYPFIDNAIARMDTVRKRKPGAANPFILGADGVTRYLGVVKECAAVAVPD